VSDNIIYAGCSLYLLILEIFDIIPCGDDDIVDYWSCMCGVVPIKTAAKFKASKKLADAVKR
jgi:hypothetical protein